MSELGWNCHHHPSWIVPRHQTRGTWTQGTSGCQLDRQSCLENSSECPLSNRKHIGQQVHHCSERNSVKYPPTCSSVCSEYNLINFCARWLILWEFLFVYLFILRFPPVYACSFCLRHFDLCLWLPFSKFLRCHKLPHCLIGLIVSRSDQVPGWFLCSTVDAFCVRHSHDRRKY